jgi:hypothetical protein
MPILSAIVPGTGISNCASGSDMRSFVTVITRFALCFSMPTFYH